MELDFSSDTPISSRNQDLLGRGSFANRIAEALASRRSPQQSEEQIDEGAFVVALCGNWGSGKTSVKNMVLESLRELPSSKQPRLVEFNPWEWSNSNKLTEEFFSEIADNLGHKEPNQKERKLAKQLRRYAKRLCATGATGEGTNKLVPVLTGAGGLTALLGWKIPETWKGTLVIIAAVFMLLFTLSQIGGDVLEKWAQSLDTEEKSSPSELKKALSNELRALPVPVLVVIDDIDRMSAEEIPHLFQLVKANANFPNVVYLLLFDRLIVEQALERVAPKLPRHAGREYLEKIVQVVFDLPAPRQDSVVQFVVDELNRIGALAASNDVDQRRWNDVLSKSIIPFFTSLRDARRFLNGFNFHLRLFMREDELMVDPIDIVAIEVLRVFEPNVYSSLPALKELLIRRFDPSSNLYGVRDSARMEEEKTKRRQALESVIDQAQPVHRAAIRTMLQLLFPATDPLLREGNSWPLADELSARDAFLNHRVCFPSYFDSYFQLTLNEDPISRKELERVFSITNDKDALLKTFAAHKERGTLIPLIRALGVFSDKFSSEDVVPFISAVMEGGDSIPYEPTGPIEAVMGPERTASNLIMDVLKRLPERTERSSQVKAAIESTSAFSVPSYFVGIQTRLMDEFNAKGEQYRIDEECCLNEADVPQIKELCVEKIRMAAQDGRLASHRELSLLLGTWSTWSNPSAPNEITDEVKGWVQRLIQTDEGTLALLKAFLRSAQGGPLGQPSESRTLWTVPLTYLERLTGEPELASAVERFKTSTPLESLDKVGSRAVRAYDFAVQRRGQNTSSDDFSGVD